MLGIDGFDYETSEQVRQEALGDTVQLANRLSNRTDIAPVDAGMVPPGGLERVADVPIYSTDALVRRATALQLTADARAPMASIPQALWQQLALREGDKVRIEQGHGHVELPAKLDATLAEHCVRVPAGHADTAGLGAMFGTLTVTRVAAGAVQPAKERA